MASYQHRANRVVYGLAFWVMLAGWGLAQENGNNLQPVPAATQPPQCCPGLTPPSCRSCGNVPQTDLTLPPGNWPPACCECDPCDPLKSACPNKDEFFLVPPRPWLYVISDGAAITRVPRRSVDFAALGMVPLGGGAVTGPAGIVLSTSDFNYDFKAAGHLVVGHSFGECLQIEGGYFGIQQSSNTAAVRDNTFNGLIDANGNDMTGDLFSPFGAFGVHPVNNLDYNNFAQIAYTSSLQSAELNVLRKIPLVPERLSMSLLFGVRYITLGEDLQYDTQSSVVMNPPNPLMPGTVDNSIHVTTSNDMVGPQIGALFELYTDNRWWINTEVKAAVLNNNAAQTTNYTNTINGGFPPGHPAPATVREDHTAFAGQLSITAVYRWTTHFTTRVGYEALWLEGAALAPDNFTTNVNILRQGPAQLNHDGGVVYHGPLAGVELDW
jgi:hypothetical protein